MSCSATKLMKKRKDAYNEMLKKKKGYVTEEVVEEVIEEEIVVDAGDGVVTGVEVVEYTEEELNGKLKSELKEIASELGLDDDGTKAELIEKILNV